MVKNRLEKAKSLWVEELPSILLGILYNSPNPDRKTPFQLTYGSEAMIPAEIGLPRH